MKKIFKRFSAWLNNAYADMATDEMVFIEMCKLN